MRNLPAILFAGTFYLLVSSPSFGGRQDPEFTEKANYLSRRMLPKFSNPCRKILENQSRPLLVAPQAWVELQGEHFFKRATQGRFRGILPKDEEGVFVSYLHDLMIERFKDSSPAEYSPNFDEWFRQTFVQIFKELFPSIQLGVQAPRKKWITLPARLPFKLKAQPGQAYYELKPMEPGRSVLSPFSRGELRDLAILFDEEGRVTNADGSAFIRSELGGIGGSGRHSSGWFDFGMTEVGDIRVMASQGEKQRNRIMKRVRNHGSLNHGKALAAIGEVEIDEFGHLVAAVNTTGHYMNSLFYIVQFYAELEKRKLDIATIFHGDLEEGDDRVRLSGRQILEAFRPTLDTVFLDRP